MSRHITIIGAGIVGIACASYLRRDGHEVTVVDMRAPGEYCSFGNAGILSPASCVPFGLPGVLKKVPGYLMDPLGPLTIRWGHLPRALPWLMRFVAASKPERVEAIADALRVLVSQTFDAYAPLTHAAGCADIVRERGYLVLYESEAAWRADTLGWKIRRERGVEYEELSPVRIAELEPALAPIYARGAYILGQGHVVNPLRLTQALAAQFQRDGGRIEQRRVLDIDIGPQGPRALRTDAGEMPVQTLLICAGAHSNEFSRRLGDDVPLESQRGYHVSIEASGVELSRPVMSFEQKFFATPMETGLRAAGAVEIGGTEAPPNYQRADAIHGHLRRMFPGLAAGEVSKWMGHRPCMPDSLPVIDRSSRFANTFYAFGHGHVGLCTGAPTARVIADLIAGRTPKIDIAPYRATRFR